MREMGGEMGGFKFPKKFSKNFFQKILLAGLTPHFCVITPPMEGDTGGGPPITQGIPPIQ